MEILVIEENTVQNGSQLKTANGLSLLIKKDGKNILFDTGPKDLAIENAKTLGIDLASIDAVVISHGHNDHTGGLLKFLQLNSKAPVYLKKEAIGPHYAMMFFLKVEGGMDPEIPGKHDDRLKFVEKTAEILPDVFIVPDITMTFPIPKASQGFLAMDGGQLVPDTWKHELFMVIKDQGKLTVITGCGHSGIKNIVATTKRAFPGEHIGAVIGGFHFQMPVGPFRRVSREDVAETARWLLDQGVDKVYTGHCSGDYGVANMGPVLKDRLVRLHTGMEIAPGN